MYPALLNKRLQCILEETGVTDEDARNSSRRRLTNIANEGAIEEAQYRAIFQVIERLEVR